MNKIAFLLLVSVLAMACSNKQEMQPGNPDEPTAEEKSSIPGTIPYSIEDPSKIMTFPSGLKLYTVQEGPGDFPTFGSTVTVHYHGLLENGKVFDSSFRRGQSFAFVLGDDGIMPGWNEGIPKLRYGSKAIMIIPPELAYGEEGYEPNIPGNSTLIFHVELLGNF